MDFIVDNYVWFIVVGIIILMAVIGYIADKTDFGRKGKTEKVVEKKKEKPKKEKKPQPTKIEVDAKGINELSQDVAEKNFNNSDNPVEPPVNSDEVSLPPIDDSEPVVDQQFTAPMANEAVDQSLFAPLTEETTENKVDQVVENNQVNEVINEEPQNGENNQVDELQNINPTTLPETNEENKNEPVAEDEDIWKF